MQPTHEGTVSGAWRYPVKSLVGEAQDALTLNGRGIVGDRVFAVYGTDGKIGSGKSTRRFRRMTGLLGCSAHLVDDGVRVSMPDGSECNAPSEDATARLSDLLGERVEVRRERDVSHLDAAPVHVLTTASLAWLSARLGAEEVDVARFRPNILIATPDRAAGRVEDSWVGARLSMGTAILEVTGRAERCVMVTMGQTGLDADERILRLLAEESEACFGVYARVVTVGTIPVGAPVMQANAGAGPSLSLSHQ